MEMALTGIPPLRKMALSFTLAQRGVTEEELFSHRRGDNLVEARALFVRSIKTFRKLTAYQKIGDWLGGRDHTTIMNLHQKAVLLRLSDPAFSQQCHEFAVQFAERTARARSLVVDGEAEAILEAVEELREILKEISDARR